MNEDLPRLPVFLPCPIGEGRIAGADLPLATVRARDVLEDGGAVREATEEAVWLSPVSMRNSL